MRRGGAVVSVLAGIAALIFIGAAAYFWNTPSGSLSYLAASALQSTPTSTVPSVRHQPTPEAVRAVYLSACGVSTPSLRDRLVRLIEATELNSIVIDIKDYSGRLSYAFPDPELAVAATGCVARDLPDFIERLHDAGVYVIGRITVFQDPHYTALHPELAVKKASDHTIVWRDRKGLSFVDVGARPFWDYIVNISAAAAAIGFDELNYDYIRFPSDGDLNDIAFTWSEGRTKPEALETFFADLSKRTRPLGVKISADLFGMVTTSRNDMGIGQVFERALPYFDYIAPMVYPSHFPNGFNGWTNPNAVPGAVINFTLNEAVRRAMATTTEQASFAFTRQGTTTPAVYTKPAYPANVVRPWLQDFDLGGTYTAEMVRAQIQATYDAGLNSWMLWDPANEYTRAALQGNE